MTECVEVHEPYQEAGQQHETDMMGMNLFLATEIMLFGGLCIVIVIYRFLHPEEIVAASARLHMWISAANTVVLLISSFAAAAAIKSARHAHARRSAHLLAAAAALGLTFLGLKAYEYHAEYTEGLLPILSNPPRFSGPVEQLFMNLYLLYRSTMMRHRCALTRPCASDQAGRLEPGRVSGSRAARRSSSGCRSA
ncbi:MAG TPA: hypothetical protein VHL31_19755, partial [Geminicoccus sp.]|nr:hypothetical protein [Geminicoccus sp.]